ncbi:hypothetical protein [Macrococcus capreoli]|uniref:hypothetical protein n=1 Tax=Macrococcus capreoli TaxID=2982690 RepID=UPI003EE515F8
MFDKNIAVIAKYFNTSPVEIMNGDYHYYIYQYNLAIEDEVNASTSNNKKVESLFDAF